MVPWPKLLEPNPHGAVESGAKDVEDPEPRSAHQHEAVQALLRDACEENIGKLFLLLLFRSDLLL